MTEVAVFVRRGKRAWKFEVYSRDYNSSWPGCNIVNVPDSVPRADAKAYALRVIKANMQLDSQLAPTGIKIAE